MRTCRISKGNAPSEDLRLLFFKPWRDQASQGEFVARARLICSHFDIPGGAIGADEVQAFLSLFITVLADIKRLDREEGFKIFWQEPGDLHIRDFWTYQE
jgi:hypothetical protein